MNFADTKNLMNLNNKNSLVLFVIYLLVRENLTNKLFDLKRGDGLRVCLIPAPDPKHSGHCVRAVESENPRWYQNFCSLYGSNRKATYKKWRTRIKRQATINALEKITGGAFDPGKIYHERIINFVEKEFESYHETADGGAGGFGCIDCASDFGCRCNGVRIPF